MCRLRRKYWCGATIRQGQRGSTLQPPIGACRHAWAAKQLERWRTAHLEHGCLVGCSAQGAVGAQPCSRCRQLCGVPRARCFGCVLQAGIRGACQL